MPDDRLLHLALGQSEKVNKLDDLGRLVWLMYKLASDDFGVMRFSSLPLQSAAKFLEDRPAKAIMRALTALREVNLIQVFNHQGTLYVYQWDWQTWQKITHPRQTKQPKPPADVLATCDANTLWLFSYHPKGGKLKSWQAPDQHREKTGSQPGVDPEETGSPPGIITDDAGSPPGHNPKQTGPVLVGVGSDRVGVSDRVSGGGTARQAFTGRVLEVPTFLDDEFVKRLNGQPFNLPEFYQALDRRLVETGETWDLRWIRDQFSVQSPVPERHDERPITNAERKKAEDYRRAVGHCPHAPDCASHAICIANLVWLWREEEREVLRGRA